MVKKKPDMEVEDLKTELTSLKIRLKRVEEFLLAFPNVDDYLNHKDTGFDDDELLDEATKIIRQYDRASASLIQRRLSIGYARSARILDQLETKGVVGPSEGANARKVLKNPTGQNKKDEKI